MKMLIECLSKDPTKPALQCAYFDGKHAYSTDGHRLFRCEYKHELDPFLFSRPQLLSAIKGLRKNKQVKLDLSTIQESDLIYSFNHEITLTPTQSSAILHNIQLLNDLPLTALKFEPNQISINHGIGGRWLSDSYKMEVLNCVTTFNHNYALPIIAVTVKYLNINHLFTFDKIDISTELTPVLLRNSHTKSIYLILPVRLHEGKPFS
jgi:hypothetical protein